MSRLARVVYVMAAPTIGGTLVTALRAIAGQSRG